MFRPMRTAAALALLAATSCSTPEPTYEPLPTVLEVAHSAGAKLGGVAIGDVLPEHDGPEIVAVCVDGRVIVVHREDGRWRSQVAFQAPGELIQVAVGDLVPSYPGDEILAVGMAEGDEDSGGPGAVWLGTRHRDRGFEARKILETDALQHAAVIGDVDVGRDGLEALSSGFDQRMHLFTVSMDGGEIEVAHEDVGALPGPAKGACMEPRPRFGDKMFESGTAFFACASGDLIRASSSTVHDDPFVGISVMESVHYASGLARPAVWVDDRGDGGHMAIAADDGALVFMGKRSSDVSTFGPSIVHQESKKLRGAAFLALDDLGTASHVATAGYEGRITAISLASIEAGAPDPVTLADTGAALHHLAAGDVRPDVPGDELVAVGYAGEIYVLSR